MALSMISAKIDSDDKINFEKFCSSAGMNVTTAINLFVKAVLREGRIPFEIRVDPFWSEENQNRLRRAAREMEEGLGAIHEIAEG